ncbi:hypothetical protein [Halobacillus sp. H74]|uniref:hypothetical protein n=1 Tax=Halobacillus sp. H74 TaxID=3457436 RepID=UPI003FCE3437
MSVVMLETHGGKFEVTRDWLEEKVNERDMKLSEFMDGYTWDDSEALYEEAKMTDGIVLNRIPRITAECFDTYVTAEDLLTEAIRRWDDTLDQNQLRQIRNRLAYEIGEMIGIVKDEN